MNKNKSNILIGHFENGVSVAKPTEKSVSVYQISANDFSVVASLSQTVIYKTESKWMQSANHAVVLALAKREAIAFSKHIASGVAEFCEKGICY